MIYTFPSPVHSVVLKTISDAFYRVKNAPEAFIGNKLPQGAVTTTRVVLTVYVADPLKKPGAINHPLDM